MNDQTHYFIRICRFQINLMSNRKPPEDVLCVESELAQVHALSIGYEQQQGKLSYGTEEDYPWIPNT